MALSGAVHALFNRLVSIKMEAAFDQLKFV